MTGDYRVEPLSHHDRSLFSSGDEELDRYFRTLARQDLRRRFTTAFVAVETPDEAVIGFYTLAATSVPMDALPQDLARRLPRYPLVPAVLVGRFAVRRDRQGQGLGGELLLDAMRRAIDSEIGAYAAIVRPKNHPAQLFYERYGFRPLGNEADMFLPLATVEAAG